VKVLSFSAPLWKRGAGGDFIIKIIHLISMSYCIVKIPLNPPFSKGEIKDNTFTASIAREACLDNG